MNIYCFASVFSFIHNIMAFIDIKGELSFDVYTNERTRNLNENRMVAANENTSNKRASKEVTAAFMIDAADDTTAKTTAHDDCVYQYPNAKQVEALLSDMMNQLTRIFVRAYDYVGGQDALGREKRFKVIRQALDSRFFEHAYSLMSKEYRHSINTTEGSKLSSHDPCHHQAELKQLWGNLLERSKVILKRAAVRCVSDFLRVRNRADDTRAKEQLGQLLLREIREVRSNQLKVLCDGFKLCYKELLH